MRAIADASWFGALAVGLLFAGAIWPLTALMRATPRSLWARRF